MVSSLKVSPQNPVCAIPTFPKNVLRAPLHLIFIWSPEWYWPGGKATVISLHLATGVFFLALFSNTLIFCLLRWMIKFPARII